MRTDNPGLCAFVLFQALANKTPVSAGVDRLQTRGRSPQPRR
jgi:hypothetical protein